MLSSQHRETSTHRGPPTVLHWTQSWTESLTRRPFERDVLPNCQQAPPGCLKGAFAGFPRFLQTHLKKVICGLCWDCNKLNYSSGPVIYHIMVDCSTLWKTRDSVLSQLPLIFWAVVLEIFKEHVLFSSENLPSCKHSISNSRKMFLAFGMPFTFKLKCQVIADKTSFFSSVLVTILVQVLITASLLQQLSSCPHLSPSSWFKSWSDFKLGLFSLHNTAFHQPF